MPISFCILVWVLEASNVAQIHCSIIHVYYHFAIDHGYTEQITHAHQELSFFFQVVT